MDIKSEFSFSRGIARDRETGYLILVNDELAFEQIPHAYVCGYRKQEVLKGENLKWEVAGICVSRQPMVQLVAVGVFGNVLVRGSGSEHTEAILPVGTAPSVRFRCVRDIDGHAYAAGMDRCVYRRDGRDTWVQMDRGARLTATKAEVVGFEAIDGFSSRDIYGVGWEGEIWHFNGGLWRQVDSPVNTILTSVCCASDGHVYAGGRLGVLMVGRDNSWELIEHNSIKADIWDLAWFSDRLYLSTRSSLYILRNRELVEVDFGLDIPGTCHQLSASEGILCSVGSKDIMLFDGTSWRRVI